MSLIYPHIGPILLGTMRNTMKYLLITYNIQLLGAVALHGH